MGDDVGRASGAARDLTHRRARSISRTRSGLLYSAFTYYTGFKVNSGEYKVMGLAPYGEPRFAKLILDNLIDLKQDGSFRLNLRLFRLLHRPAHDQCALRRAVRRAGRASPSNCSTSATWISPPRSRR